MIRSNRRSGHARAPSAAPSLRTASRADLPLDLKETVQEFEIDLLNRALEEGRFNQRRAAELLGLTYHQLRGYLKKYNLLKSSDAASE